MRISVLASLGPHVTREQWVSMWAISIGAVFGSGLSMSLSPMNKDIPKSSLHDPPCSGKPPTTSLKAPHTVCMHGVLIRDQI